MNFSISYENIRFDYYYKPRSFYFERYDNLPVYKIDIRCRIETEHENFEKIYPLVYRKNLDGVVKKSYHLYIGDFEVYLPRLMMKGYTKKDLQSFKRSILSSIKNLLPEIKEKVEEEIEKNRPVIIKAKIMPLTNHYMIDFYLKGYKNKCKTFLSITEKGFRLDEIEELKQKKWRAFEGWSYYFYDDVLDQLSRWIKRHPSYRLKLLHVRECFFHDTSFQSYKPLIHRIKDAS